MLMSGKAEHGVETQGGKLELQLGELKTRVFWPLSQLLLQLYQLFGPLCLSSCYPFWINLLHGSYGCSSNEMLKGHKVPLLLEIAWLVTPPFRELGGAFSSAQTGYC